MIKSDRFWYRINNFKKVAGLRRSLNSSKKVYLKQNIWLVIMSLPLLVYLQGSRTPMATIEYSWEADRRVQNVLLYQVSLRSAHVHIYYFISLDKFPHGRGGGKLQLSTRLKPTTVLNLLIRYQKRSLLTISLFFNDKVTLQLVSGAVNSLPILVFV